jgi:hypothetical protein
MSLSGYEVEKVYQEVDMSKLLVLNRENYFSLEANRQYCSVSQYKSFRPEYGGCEAAALAVLKNEWVEPEKGAFTEGHYLHAWQSNELDEFKMSNPEIYSSKGPTAGQLKSDYQHLNKMIEVLERDEFVMRVLSGEKEVIMTASLFGVPFKIMIDSYRPAMKSFADLKGLKDIGGRFWKQDGDTGYWENFIQHYGYDLQMAVYAEVERIAKGREIADWLIPHLVIVTKQKPEPDHEIIFFDSEMIKSKLAELEMNLPRVIAVKNGEVEPEMCGTCSYCLSKKRLTAAKFYREFDLY